MNQKKGERNLYMRRFEPEETFLSADEWLTYAEQKHARHTAN